MNNILEERDKGITERRRVKKHLDSIINLSEGGDNARLLDEGAVVVGEDTVRLFIKKGAIEKFMNGENVYLPNIDDNYTGYINLGHDDFYANPISLIGSWNKSDLSVVDIGNGRKGIDVNVRLWDWHPFASIIHNLPYKVGISAEFLGHLDYESSEELGYSVYDEICITDFAVVGNGANVNSNGLMLKGENMKDMDKLQASLNEMAEENTEDTPTVEPATDDTVDNEDNTVVDDTSDDSTDANSDDNSDDSVDLSAVLAKIEELTTKVGELRDENKELKDKLDSKDAEMQKFTERFHTLSVKLNPALGKKEEVKEEEMSDRYDGHNDGIGV